jgi:phosphate starvation-inducible PhoH-like protein
LADEDPLILQDNAIAQALYGESDRNLRALEREVGVKVQARGNRIRVQGPPLECKLARRVLQELYDMAASGVMVGEREVQQMTRMAHDSAGEPVRAMLEGDAVEVGRRRRIVPKTAVQRCYLNTIKECDLTFGYGPAGTGKTYLAMACAVSALMRREIGRIILTRPAIEAGEKLGYLPGDLFEKVDPYLWPLYDALYDMMDVSEVAQRMDRGIIEVAPLAFMRGRTLNDAFVILDEAQNTTSEQMRMFLTRLGFDSKAVVNGDPTQVDLSPGAVSGLDEARTILKGIPGIEFVGFTEKDVVRHPLVQQIVQAYERHKSSD